MSKNEKIRKVPPDFVIYETDGNAAKVSVRLENENVWLTQAQLADLYQSSKSNISEHIKHIFEEGELDENAVVRKFRTTASDGKNYETAFYNLDLIISLGYRVKSHTATRFRIWATERLKEYIIKGFTLDDERLKNIGGGGYWRELLDRIRDIRFIMRHMETQLRKLFTTAPMRKKNLWALPTSRANSLQKKMLK